MGLRSISRKCRFWQKKIIFSDETHFDLGGYVNNQNCRIWSLLVRILVQRHNWSILLRKWARRGRYSHVERIFEEEDIGNIWFQQEGATCQTAGSKLNILRSVFGDHIISRRADIVWPPRSCDLTPLDYYLRGAVKDKCCADKPKTIDALKDNIREAIGEIQCTQSIVCLKIRPIV